MIAFAFPSPIQHTRHFPNPKKKKKQDILFSSPSIDSLLNSHNHNNMQSISLINSSPIFHPLSSTKFGCSNGRKFSSLAPIMASKRGEADQNFGGWLVDESMIVLRKRIHEMNMIERNYEPPSDWMEWEKRYYTSYDSIICEAMGVLQTQLMNTRPSVALGAMALVAISVPTSTALVLHHMVELGKVVLAGIHLS